MFARLITFVTIVTLSSISYAEANSKDGLILKDRSFKYQVSEYEICIKFTAEKELTWTYLEAPNGEKGKTADEVLDRYDLRKGQVLLSWTEASGVNVTDVFDFREMKLYASVVFTNGNRFTTTAYIHEVPECS